MRRARAQRSQRSVLRAHGLGVAVRDAAQQQLHDGRGDEVQVRPHAQAVLEEKEEERAHA